VQTCDYTVLFAAIDNNSVDFDIKFYYP
jgi:hypothetical protein